MGKGKNIKFLGVNGEKILVEKGVAICLSKIRVLSVIFTFPQTAWPPLAILRDTIHTVVYIALSSEQSR